MVANFRIGWIGFVSKSDCGCVPVDQVVWQGSVDEAPCCVDLGRDFKYVLLGSDGFSAIPAALISAFREDWLLSMVLL